jgi:hypothetical protein
MKYKIIVLCVMVGVALSSNAQKKEDSIKNLTNYSLRYLDELYNQRNIDSVTSFWSSINYKNLKVGYNNGGISYSSENDLRRLFKKDIDLLLKDEIKPVKFQQVDDIYMFLDAENNQYFIISFDLKFGIKLDSTLQTTSLDFISKDQGKTWKINDDHWIQSFMYYLYRRGKN